MSSVGHGGRQRDGGRRRLARLGFGRLGFTETEPERGRRGTGRVLRGRGDGWGRLLVLICSGEQAGIDRQAAACLPASPPLPVGGGRRRKEIFLITPCRSWKTYHQALFHRKQRGEKKIEGLFVRINFGKNYIWKPCQISIRTMFWFSKIGQDLDF